MSMINLMPPAHKESILYARRNTYLVRWLIGISVAAVGIVVISGGGLFYLKQDSKAYQKSIEDTKAHLTAQKETETLRRAEEMSGNLQLVVDVLSNEVLFSKLLQQIGQVIPPGTILQSLTLSNDLSGGIDLEIGASSYETGVRAQVNLAEPSNGIFEKADIGAVTCPAEGVPPYPCTAQMRALFGSDNSPFLKLNQGGTN